MYKMRIRVIAALLAMGLVSSITGINSNANEAGEKEVIDIVVNEQVPLSPEIDTLELPSKVDNSEKIYFPPIIEQGKFNSCASWAMAYYQTSYEFNRLRDKDGSLIENQLSPVFTYNLTNNGKNEGTYYTDVAKVLKEVGTVSMADLPADTVTGPMPIGDISAQDNIWRNAHKNRITEYVPVYDGNADRMGNSTPITSANDEDLVQMKTALNNGYVLTASTPGNKWKYKTIEANASVPANDSYLGEEIMTVCDREGYMGHRITIVGYSDEIWVDINENGQVDESEFGAFKIANTRGTEYGNEGYMWVSYDTLNIISACMENSKVDLGFENREPSLIDVGYIKVEAKEKVSPYTLEFEATTNNAKGMAVVVTATEKTGNRDLSIYKVTPFGKSIDIGLGKVGFDGTENVTTGSFSIALDNLFADIETRDLDNYDWHIKISSMDSNTNITYSNLRIVDKNLATVYTSSEYDYLITDKEVYVKLDKVS